MNETMKVVLVVIGAGGLACVLIGVASMVGKFLKANAEVVSAPTPETVENTITDPGETTVVVRPSYLLRLPPYIGIKPDPENTEPMRMWEAEYRSKGKHRNPERTS